MAELRQFVEEQHPAMAEGDLPRFGDSPAPDESGVGDGVVRGAEGAGGDERRAGVEHSGDAVDLGRLQRLAGGERGEDGGHGAGEERLAASGRAGHQEVVASGGGDLHRPLRLILPAYVRHIHREFLRGDGLQLDDGGVREDRGVAADVLHEFPQGARAEHVDAVHERGLVGVRGGHDGRPHSSVAREPDHREHAVGAAEMAFQREFADEHGLAEHHIDLAAAREDADGDGEVVGGPFLAEVGGSETDGDAAHREFEARVPHRRADALPGFLHRRVGQPDDHEVGQPGGDVHLHLDDRSVEPCQRARLDLR